MEKGLGYLFVISNSSHFFNKTDFEQYLCNENAIVTVRKIAVILQQARRHGGISWSCLPKSLLVLPKQELCPPSENCAGKKVTGSVSLKCNSRPETPKILVITPEFVSKNCFLQIL